jgi:C-terminal processing protease CtpA/Prc
MQAAKSQDSSQVAVETKLGWIGVSTKHVDEGAKVTAVVPNGPAAAAGIQVGDVIQQLNGTNIKHQDFESELANFQPGTKVLVSYMHSAWAHDTLVTVGKSLTAK